MKPFVAAAVFFVVLIVVVAGAWKTIKMNRIAATYDTWTNAYPSMAVDTPARTQVNPPNVKVLPWAIVPTKFYREVVGEIVNTNSVPLSLVEIRFDGLDASGAIIDSVSSSQSDLDPGARWKYRITLIDDRIEKLKLKFVGNPYAN